MHYSAVMIVIVLGHCILAASAPTEDGSKYRDGLPRERKEGRSGQAGAAAGSFTFHTEVPPHDLDVLLCRPTATRVEASVLVYAEASTWIRYGLTPDDLTLETSRQVLNAGEPVVFPLEGLRSDQTYHYQVEARDADGHALNAPPPSSFHTQRPPGSAFIFAIQADSHLDGATNPAVYMETLRHEVESKPDFLIDLGDTFMTDKHPDRGSAHKQYLAQRYYFGQVACSAPLFLALGNHDGEQGGLSTGVDSLAVWSNGMRKKYFPNPIPDEFYSGNSLPHPEAGLLENYYAWTWGDALFVVLDPFWHCGANGRGAVAFWDRSLGEAQYRWLAETLSASRAAHKFVFIHHLVGGGDKNSRGGAEASHYFEWGGHELDGSETFDTRRAGWPDPIHALMVEHGVSVVFHGHDHFFMKQERDGVIYQLVPQPGHKGQGSARSAAEYGYSEGNIVTGSGYLRVAVTPEAASVEFMRTPLGPASSEAIQAPEVAYEYSIPARRDQLLEVR